MMYSCESDSEDVMPTDEKSRLATELSLYATHKAEWLEKHSGQYVVAQDRNLLGFYDSWESAFKAGVVAFGVQKDFLVRQVLAHEPVYFIY
jgi:hypothetical protein